MNGGEDGALTVQETRAARKRQWRGGVAGQVAIGGLVASIALLAVPLMALVPWLPLAVPVAFGLTAGISLTTLAHLPVVLRLYRQRNAARTISAASEAGRERAESEIRRLIAAASHDLKEPLRVVAGFARTLNIRHGARFDPDIRELLDRLLQGTARMEHMVDGMRDLAQAEGGPVDRSAFALEAAVRESLANLQAAIEESDATVSLGPLPLLRADRPQTVRLVQNLVSNAIRHRNGRAPQIDIGARRAGETWCVEVRDNGPGIPRAERDRVFESFERGPTGDGLGLGLALCRRIVERHGGRIWVESAEDGGGGSVFRFTIPDQTADPATAAALIGAPTRAESVVSRSRRSLRFATRDPEAFDGATG